MMSSPAPNGRVKLDPRTGQFPVLTERRRWLVRLHGRELRLVETEEELRTLVQQQSVANETQVYEVGAGPHALGDVPELARILLETPPPDEIVLEDLGPRAHAKLNEELRILDRPLETEVEYYDEVPVSRWPSRLAFLGGLALVSILGCLLLAPHLPAREPRLLGARLVSAAHSLWSPAAPASPPPTPAPAVPATAAVAPPAPLPPPGPAIVAPAAALAATSVAALAPDDDPAAPPAPSPVRARHTRHHAKRHVRQHASRSAALTR